MRSANHSELSNALLAISQSLADRSQLPNIGCRVDRCETNDLSKARHHLCFGPDRTGVDSSTAHHNDKTVVSHPWEALQLDSASENDPFNFAIRNGEVVLINELYKYNGYDCESIYQTEQTLGLKARTYWLGL